MLLVRAFLPAVLLLGACVDPQIEIPGSKDLERLTGFKFGDPPRVVNSQRTRSGPFGSDTTLTADYSVVQSDLKALIEGCEKLGFKKRSVNPALPDEMKAKISPLQRTAVCVKDVNENGHHLIYVGPDGLEYVYVNQP